MTQWIASKNIALVGVDIQNGFCTGGNLAVPQGENVVPLFNSLREHFQTVVITQDFHPEGHSSFASTHGREPMERVWMKEGEIVGEIDTDNDGNPLDGPEHAPVDGAIVQVLWPDHCVQGTTDANFHPDLDIQETDLIIQKGKNQKIDSYSAFYENDGKTQPTFDGGELDGKTFSQGMQDKEIDTLVFTGLASDFCVGWHALDAIKEGFNAVVIYDATKPIAIPLGDEVTTETLMLNELKAVGVKIISSKEAQAALTL